MSRPKSLALSRHSLWAAAKPTVGGVGPGHLLSLVKGRFMATRSLTLREWKRPSTQ